LFRRGRRAPAAQTLPNRNEPDVTGPGPRWSASMDVIWNSKRTVAAALALGAAIGLTPGCRRTEEARPRKRRRPSPGPRSSLRARALA